MASKSKNNENAPSELYLSFDSEYNEKTGLLEIFNLILHRENLISIPESERDEQNCVEFNEQQLASWRYGTLIHVLFQFESKLNTYSFATAFLNRHDAEAAFADAEASMWESIQSRRISCPGKVFSVVKVDPWHCDLLECVSTERGGWKRPVKGHTWFLRSLVLKE